MMKRFVLIVVLYFVTLPMFAHPIKMTTARFYLNEETQQYELLINFYIDDFTTHLNNIYNTSIEHSTIINRESKSVIVDYIADNFLIYVGSQKIKLALKSEDVIEDNILQIQLVVKELNKDTTEEIKVVNTLLFDAFESQSNILHLELGYEKKKSIVRFTSIAPTYVFSIN